MQSKELISEILKLGVLMAALWCFWRAYSKRPGQNRKSILASLGSAGVGMLLAGGHFWMSNAFVGQPYFGKCSLGFLGFTLAVDLIRASLLMAAIGLMVQAGKIFSGKAPIENSSPIRLLLMGILIALTAAGSRIHTPRFTESRVPCGDRLGLLRAVAWQWARDHQVPDGTPVTANNLKEFSSHHLRCPEGGTYTLTKFGDLPVCSYHRDVQRVPERKWKEIVIAIGWFKPFWRAEIARKYLLWEEAPGYSSIWRLSGE